MWLWTGDQPQTRRSPQPPPIINWKITQQRSQETLNLPSDLGLQSRSYPMLSNRLTSPTHTLSFSRPNLTGHQSAGHPHLRMLGVLASRKPVQHPTGGDDEVWLRVLSKWLAFLMTITAAQKSSRDLHVDGASSEKIGCPEQVLSSCTFSDLVTFCGRRRKTLVYPRDLAVGGGDRNQLTSMCKFCGRPFRLGGSLDFVAHARRIVNSTTCRFRDRCSTFVNLELLSLQQAHHLVACKVQIL